MSRHVRVSHLLMSCCLSADGMPIYEGDCRIWQHYKTKLEREAEMQLQPQNNPMMLITEYFPDVRIVEGPLLDGSVFFSARLVFDQCELY